MWLLRGLARQGVITGLFLKVAAVPSLAYFILGKKRRSLLKNLRADIKDCFKIWSIPDGFFVIKLEFRV